MKTEQMIEDLKNDAMNLSVLSLASTVIGDPRFPLWSGSSKPFQHHYGTGGLLRHTYEVVKLCQIVRLRFYTNVDAKILFLAALFHDYGKIWDYVPVIDDPPQTKYILDTTEWTSGSHKRVVHHISRSVIEWEKAAQQETVVSESERQEVTHAILAHHGQREFGSPVAPYTQIAWLLHFCDGISARMDDCDKMDYLKHRKDS